jgi:small subunit ribosomal protein S9
MPTKKVVKKSNPAKAPLDKTKETVKEKKQYFYAVGRRKTAIARVKIFPAKNSQSELTINGRKFEDYFSINRMRDSVKSPLNQLGEGKSFDIEVKVSGSGVSAQADAIKLGIARALVVFSADLKKALKKEGHLKRDPREVERKKPGLKKARKSPQWAKR